MPKIKKNYNEQQVHLRIFGDYMHLADEIEKFQVNNQLKSKNEAILVLLEKGVASDRGIDRNDDYAKSIAQNVVDLLNQDDDFLLGKKNDATPLKEKKKLKLSSIKDLEAGKSL